MNVALLLREFARLADSSEAIAKLRQFATRLAVTGRLCDQLAAEWPPDGVRSLPDVIPGQAAGLPANWLTGQLGRLIDLRYGKGLAASERIEQGRVAVYGSNGVVGRTRSALTNAPAIIVGRKGSAGALTIADGPSWTTDVAYYLVPPPYFDIRFLFLALQVLDLAGLSKGVKPGLSLSDTQRLLLPVPPLAEQHRIVAKVDELMALCNQLEAAQNVREARRDGLRAASQHRLMASDGHAELGSPDVRFFLDTSPRLITKPEHVADVRQLILDLAIRGRLTLQTPDDEPTSELLKKIALERAGFLEGGRGASGNAVSSKAPEAPLPKGWALATIGEIALNVTDGFHNTPVPVPSGRPYVTAQHVKERGIDFANCLYVGESDHEELISKTRVRRGDILVVNIGAGCGTPARVEVDFEFSFKNVAILNLPTVVDHDYVFYWLSGFKSTLFREATKGGAQPFLGLAMLRGLTFALPPLMEQHRVVARLDRLMATCDELEAALASAQDGRVRLLDALLHEALEGGAARSSVGAETAV